jgi:glycosyltransferase involved in cell wall biosynthesis
MDKTVSIITSSIGTTELYKACSSVLEQDYKKTNYIVVSDGPKYKSKVKKQLKEFKNKYISLELPYNTGAGGIGGYRSYIALSFLVNSDYICFLDEDNWLDSNHVSSLVNLMNSNEKLDWCYSLRKVYTKDEQYLFNDDCESLGKWPVWTSQNNYHVDIGAYFFKTEFVRSFIGVLNRPVIGDRVLLSYLLKYSLENFACSGQYTLNYRLGGNPNSVTKEFFIEGNKKIKQLYPEKFPWLNYSSVSS